MYLTSTPFKASVVFLLLTCTGLFLHLSSRPLTRVAVSYPRGLLDEAGIGTLRPTLAILNINS